MPLTNVPPKSAYAVYILQCEAFGITPLPHASKMTTEELYLLCKADFELQSRKKQKRFARLRVNN